MADTIVDKQMFIASNGTNYIPMWVTGGDMSQASLEKLDTTCYLVSGADVFCPDVVVRTTKKEITEMMNEFSADDCRKVFPQVWKVIKNTNTDALYTAGGRPWANFMEDILIYYVCRFKLFGTPIPCIVDDPALLQKAKSLTPNTFERFHDSSIMD